MNDDSRDNPSGKTPAGGASYMGATPESPDANTNLDSNLATGPQTAVDRAAMQTIHGQGTETGAMPDPARQSDNSGMVRPTGDTEDADIIGASGNDRNGDRTGS
ncbi:hypothetical protein [Deinococcus hopiensis]|uniref:Uncharacterized protein n=1 Tax=Deinococcus hopiensis KR-140 TaxID=695939 RepID=A0A1W1VRW3_9DEIO|nr:hypothetical protein [Deinococcus hopiensis]SMB96003.1 hypothetical protein SAMN00790413_03107 [Deinococcus hopiensis KR-140]